MRARVRTCLFVAIGVLYVLSVPWYRETGAPVGFVLGLPDWVGVSVGCYVGVAVLNALAWLLAEPAAEPPRSPPEPAVRREHTPRAGADA